ncbi:MAG: hypothetical protein JSV41_06205 [Gemmatimonadota bacterium]|nr:MAG: hypothetical protein JSV41_06205 [Gemmatimonadota bacterium]
MAFLSRFLESARRWAVSRSWHWRALVLAYLVYAASRSLADADYVSMFSGITLVFHEMGHILFSPFGDVLMIAGGSITQLAIPIVVALYLLLRQGDYFGFAVGGAWLGFSALDLARYIGDARILELPLVSLGPEAEHDWFYLLSRLGWLRYDTQIAGLVRSSGTVILFLSIAFGVWLCFLMGRGSGARDDEAREDPETRKFKDWLRERGS